MAYGHIKNMFGSFKEHTKGGLDANGENFKVFLKKRSKDSLTKLTSCLLQHTSLVVKISVLAWFNSLLKRGQKLHTLELFLNMLMMCFKGTPPTAIF